MKPLFHAMLKLKPEVGAKATSEAVECSVLSYNPDSTDTFLVVVTHDGHPAYGRLFHMPINALKLNASQLQILQTQAKDS